MGTVPGGIHDRHHILYPHRIWRIQPEAIRNIRGGFVMKINKVLHGQLHHEIDALLGEEVDENNLPGESTLELIANNYAGNEAFINTLEPIEKIDWLLANLTETEPRNQWLRMMISRQREFLVSHVEELKS